MNRHSFKHSASLLAVLATFFLLSGCLPDKEKAASERRERLQQQVIAANELLHAGEADRAIAQLEKLEQANPEAPQVLEALAFAYARKPDPLMAAMYFDHALRLLPSRADLALQLAQAHLENGQNDMAADAYRTYLALTPSDAAAWRRLGELEYGLQRSKPALDAYLEALRLANAAPSAEEALRLGRLYHILGNQPQASRWYAETLSRKDVTAEQRADALLGQFDLALRNKEWLAAVSLMEQLEALAPAKLTDGAYAQAYAELSAWNNTRKQQIAEAEAAAKQKAEAEKKAEADKKAAEAAKAKNGEKPENTAAKTGEKAADATTTPTAKQADATAQTTGTTQKKETATGEKTAPAADATAQSDATPSTAASDTADGGNAGQADAAGGQTDPTASDADASAPTADGAKAATAIKDKTQTGAEPADRTQTDTQTDADAATEPAPQSDKVPDGGTAPEAARSADSASDTPADPADTVSDNAAADLAKQGAEAFEKGDTAIAAELLERSVKLNPNNGKTLDLLSRAFYRNGDYPQAERYATLAIYAEPKNLSYRLEYLRAYQRNNPPAALLQQMISAKEDFPNAPAVTLALARGYEHIAQRKSLAAAIYREYLEQAPDSPHAKEIRQKLLEWEM